MASESTVFLAQPSETIRNERAAALGASAVNVASSDSNGSRRSAGPVGRR